MKIDFSTMVVNYWLIVVMLALCASRSTADKPNILFFLADDVGQECLGCYGGQSYRTPHLDHLAKTGMRFQHCYSMPMCFPTRLTLMTGRYPFLHGEVRWGSFPASEDRYTFSRMLSDAGYATAVFGKWQLTLLKNRPNHPQQLGFEHCDVFGWHEGPRYYEPMIYRNGKVRTDTIGHYGPDLYVRGLIEFMRNNRDRPFLAYFPMALCHDVTDDLDQPVPQGPFGRYDSFGEMVEEMDRSVGRVIAALNALQLREKTLILFTTDNGTPRQMILSAEGKKLIEVPVVSQRNGIDITGGKGKLTDSGTRVPLIANWQGTIEADQVVADLVDMSDFFPTFVELANASTPSARRLSGKSFASRLTSGKPSGRLWAYSQSRNPNSQSRRSSWVRTANWKLYNNGDLIDMESDPHESKPYTKQNDSSESREVRRELETTFSSLQQH